MTSTVRRRSLGDALEVATRGTRDMPALADAVCRTVRRHVPYEFGCLATTDPSTGLISWAFKSSPLDTADEEFSAAEYGGPDVNLFAEIAKRPEPVGVLSVDTAGQPETCRRFRDFLAPRFGFTDELRVVFRSQGLTWGALGLYRGPGGPAFTADEAGVLSKVHEQVAALIRHAMFAMPVDRRAGPAGPSVIVVDAADRVVSMTADAQRRIEDLGGYYHGSLPASVCAVAATARTAPSAASTRVVGESGTWLLVRATTFAPSPGSRDDVVITIDAASPADIGALTLAARGLSPREQEIAALVLQGASTRAMAETLHLSPHTVQDHLKSIFAKLGVNSRREMVGRLVLT